MCTFCLECKLYIDMSTGHVLYCMLVTRTSKAYTTKFRQSKIHNMQYINSTKFAHIVQLLKIIIDHRKQRNKQ